MFKNEKLTHLKFYLFKFEGKKKKIYIYIYIEREREREREREESYRMPTFFFFTETAKQVESFY